MKLKLRPNLSSLFSLLPFFCILALTASLSSAQTLFGEISDIPSNVIAAGAGIGPTSHDFSGFVAYGKHVTGGTYSFSSVSFIPALQTLGDGKKSLSLTTTTHTGVQQIILQLNRFTVAVDGGAGISMPSTGSTGISFSGTGAALLAWRLNSLPGPSNTYFAVRPSITQTQFGPVFAVSVGFGQGFK